MLDSNENESKGDDTLEEWVKSNNVDFDKQILPKNTDFSHFIEFVDERWELLITKLEKELKF